MSFHQWSNSPMGQDRSVCGKPVTIMQDAARELGLHLITVRDLVRAHKIDTFRVRASPAARGIDDNGMAVLRWLAGKGDKPNRTAQKIKS